MRSVQQHIKEVTGKIIHILWICSLVILFLLAMQIFVFSSFKIPSESMVPELMPGDRVVVNKLIIGARLFNIFATIRNEPTPVYRMPGSRKIKRNDVLVFNTPHPATWEKIEMNLMKYYIKRCIGLPGDTLSIQNGIYKIKNIDMPLGNLAAQRRVSRTGKDDFEECVYICFPYDSILHWNIKDFGSLYIPKANDRIVLNRTNYILYRKLIEWEQQKKLTYKNPQIYLDGQPISTYRFQTNYYFMGGDKVEDSQDSRYWGLIPEDYLVGKAWLVLNSSDPYTGESRWNRFFRIIR